MTQLDLLKPEGLQQHYIHLLTETIHAYSPTQIVIGEAIQNAIDAVVATEVGKHRITVDIDADARTVKVCDDGIGFPNDPSLLFLGGGRKREGNRKLFGKVGVGIKVVLFKSEFFSLKSSNDQGTFYWELEDAYRFDHEPPPALLVPDEFPDDEDPLPQRGTEVLYRFPSEAPEDPLQGFWRELEDRCMKLGPDKGFATTLEKAVQNGRFENRFAGLFEAYLRRFTYVGDVANRLGDKSELADTVLKVSVSSSDPVRELGETLGSSFDGKTTSTNEIEPTYLLVEDVRSWVSEPRPGMFDEALGRAGTALQRTHNGFNLLVYGNDEDYEKLLLDKQGDPIEAAEEYRDKLFPSINGIILTIGRIPLFEEFLPEGSRRVISANGVVTGHDLDLTKGRNQEYVRCFDLIIDVDAELNYGKSALKSGYLVGLVRRYINDAYRTTIQTAAGSWVGKIPQDEPEFDVFLTRPDLGVPTLLSEKVPRDENDVIGLFFELGGRGFFPEYRIFGLSQKDQYDARALIQRVGESTPPDVPPDDRHLAVVEFKTVGSYLIGDLEREVKAARDIHLLIAWEEGRTDSTRYSFADIEHSKHYPDRVFPRAQRFLTDSRSGAEVQVLLLKPLVGELSADSTSGKQEESKSS